MDGHAVSQAIDQFSDWRWRLNNLYSVVNEHGVEMPFRMNWAQERLFDEMHYLNIILKARQIGFCLAPSTRVLTADLEWVRIDGLHPGDDLVAVDERVPGGKGRARKMRTATVQGCVEVSRQAYQITFNDGREVVCTGRHPWLSRKAGPECEWRSIEADTKKKLLVGTKVRWITKPWKISGLEDYWFGGLLDGEGSFRRKSRAGTELCVSQVAGPVLDRARSYLVDCGYTFREEIDNRKCGDSSKLGNKPVHKLVMGRSDELFRVLGQTRPTRFSGGRWWSDKELPGKKSGVGWAEIVNIEPVGKQAMVDLQTSTGTYIAEGFVSHNTTFIQLFMLDACLFNSNVRAGTIAHTMEAAEEIFSDKVKFPYEHLPDGLRAANPAIQDAAKRLTFSNGSSLRVGMSLRSGTYQYLHVSEYGKLCSRYPEKAREIKTGALNTLQAGEIAFIESTAEGREGAFFDMTERAQNHQGPLTPLDFKFHFFAWHEHPSYRLDPAGVVIAEDLERYFQDLEAGDGIALDDAQRAWYAKKLETQGDDMKREYPATPKEAFLASIEGAYFKGQMARARREGRICRVPIDPILPVNTFWDLGMADNMTIWFHQRHGLENRFVGYYENSGEGFSHYARVLEERARKGEYVYGRHLAPHDIEVRNLDEEGRTRKETARKLGIVFETVPKVEVKMDGIEASRQKLASCVFDEAACDRGIKCLESYRKEWDEKHGVWKDHPRHDWASHAADAFETFARGYAPESDYDDYDDIDETGRSEVSGY